jgi:hypothetical protein
VLNSVPDPDRPRAPAAPRQLTDEELLRAIREAEPDLSIRKSTDGSMWIAVELPAPPQHRVYAGFSLRDIARSILGVWDL